MLPEPREVMTLDDVESVGKLLSSEASQWCPVVRPIYWSKRGLGILPRASVVDDEAEGTTSGEAMELMEVRESSILSLPERKREVGDEESGTGDGGGGGRGSAFIDDEKIWEQGHRSLLSSWENFWAQAAVIDGRNRTTGDDVRVKEDGLDDLGCAVTGENRGERGRVWDLG